MKCFYYVCFNSTVAMVIKNNSPDAPMGVQEFQCTLLWCDYESKTNAGCDAWLKPQCPKSCNDCNSDHFKNEKDYYIGKYPEYFE